MKSKTEGLQLGKYCMGTRELQGGVYDVLTVVGSLTGEDVVFTQLDVVGEAILTDCQIDNLRIVGEVALKGKTTCEYLRLSGCLSNEDTTCHMVTCGKIIGLHGHYNKPIISGKITMDTLENFLSLTLTKQQSCKNIINCGNLYSKDVLECERLFNFGSLQAQEVNADIAYLYPSSNVQLHEFHGSLFIVDPNFDREWLQDVAHHEHLHKKYPTSATCSMLTMQCIEADEVIVDYVTCTSIFANRVVIDAHCEIDTIEYRDSCTIHELAKVKECRKI